MEQQMERALEMAGTALDVELKHGPIRRAISGLLRRRGKNEPTDLNDFREKAMEAALKNAVETIRVQELTVGQALRILGPEFTLDDLDKVDSTWEKRWSEGASRIGIDDEERRAWWARLLAGEIQQPGTFSLRTLAVMDTLSTKEAQLFTRLCDYVWTHGENDDEITLFLPTDESELWKPSLSEMTLLVNGGLVMLVTTGTSLTSSEIRQTRSEIRLQFNRDQYSVEIPAGKAVKLRGGNLHVTEVGQEIYRLTTPKYPQDYRDEILAEWRKSYTVNRSPVASAET